jgi:Bacterial protein of unknown function (DUF853)
MTDDPNAVPGKILVGASGKTVRDRVYLYLSLPVGNHHGLISGSTGSGKTISAQRLAEGFSNAGAAVFRRSVAAGRRPARFRRPREGSRADLCAGTVPGGVLGFFWRAGPSGPRDNS